jgi:bifunctional oligoribonuclease and PAP phosphatase NrnA
MREIKDISWSKLTELISNSKRIILTTHVNSDGDGLGSEVALYHYLTSLGIDCRIINPTILPKQFSFWSQKHLIELYDTSMNDWINGVDLSIILDIGDQNRMRDLNDVIFNTTTVSIDHHPTSIDSDYDYYIEDIQAPSVGLMLWRYFNQIKAWEKYPFEIAEALYISILTDTGSFKYSNTTAEAHTMASELVGAGVNIGEMNRHIYESRSHEQVSLLQYVLNNINYSNNGKIGWFLLANKTKQDLNVSNEDVTGFTDFLRTINGVEVAVMFLEIDENKIRVNFRSKGKYIINDIASIIGGGGHKYAAGALILDKSLAQIEQQTISLLEEKII